MIFEPNWDTFLTILISLAVLEFCLKLLICSIGDCNPSCKYRAKLRHSVHLIITAGNTKTVAGFGCYGVCPDLADFLLAKF